MSDVKDLPNSELPICPFCKEQIAEGAKRCPSCGTYLGWRHIVNMFLPATATAITIAIAWQPLWDAYKTLIGLPEASKVRIIDVFFDGQELKTEVVNFNELPAVLDGNLQCREMWPSTYPIELSIYPAGHSRDEFGSNLFVAGSRLESTFVTWGTWNATVIDAPRSELDGVRHSEITEQLLAHLSAIDEYSSALELEEIANNAAQYMDQGAWLQMTTSFDYHASLSLRLLEEGVRDPQAEYSFKCTLTGLDGRGTFETNSFKITFGVGSHGINDLNPFD